MQKLLSSVSTGFKKHTQAVAFCPVKDTLQRPCQLVAKFTRGVRFCCFSLSRSLFNTC